MDKNQETTTSKILTESKKIVKKRKAYHRPAKSNEIYMTREKRFSIYLKRAVKLFNGGERKLFIYGMGASIEKAVKLALKLQQLFCGITFDIKTSTVKLIDDIIQEDEIEGTSESTNVRTNSSISIQVQKE